MNILVDWISATIPCQAVPYNVGDLHDRLSAGRLVHHIGLTAYRTLFPDHYERSKGRFPFLYSLHNPVTNAYFLYHPDLDYALLELSGRACHALTEASLLREFLSRTHLDLTRLDLSGDIETDISPGVFCQHRTDGPIRTVGSFISASGETSYVGSSSSDRRACVYRFFPPHPRSGFLRVEHRNRRERAAQIGAIVVSHGLAPAIAHCGSVFGWRHPVWSLDDPPPTEIPAIPTRARDGDRIRWLETQVIPALKKFEQEGVIPDLRSFLEEHLFHDHGDQATDSEL